ncbi:MAG: 2,3-bisphosphoglycerate-independent phosphoglycerate mutase [Rickettsiales bacterium]|nr:2,3-bisphosphoglycerate-independent phosphoglycerate mutase [Rickettsiales bacterium]
MSHRPVILCILDGWGISDSKNYNAIYGANPTNYQFFLKKFPHSKLFASEEYVGLPSLQMGNSEVGHMTIGGGRVFKQDLLRVSDTLQNNKERLKNLRNTKPNLGKVCHIVGLVSDGGVHSHINHILDLAQYYVIENIVVYFHVITDGRDTLPKSAKKYLAQIQQFCDQNVNAQIKSISGRYYVMDRDNRYERTEKAYNAIICGKGLTFQQDNILDYIDRSYTHKIFDEFIEPVVADDYLGVAKGDVVIFANFRADRMRQIVSSIVLPEFKGFSRLRNVYEEINVFTMTQYSSLLDAYVEVILKPERYSNILTDILDKHKMSQLRVAETEKYAHVTFFFDAGEEKINNLEKRILVPSPKVEKYDLKPEMSAYEVTTTIVSEFGKKRYDFCLVNYANADMVGHTGNYNATVEAVKAIDHCLGMLYKLSQEINGTLIITADHGNAELMFDDSNCSDHTAHTINPVPFIMVDHNLENARVHDGGLADIAPTILDLLGLKKPKEMTGNSLLIR